MVKKCAPYIVFVVVAIIMVWIRVMIGANSEYSSGKTALDNNDIPSAIHHFDRSIHWYSPFSSAVKSSVSELEKIADIYNSKENIQGELYTLRILRSALYSIRHIRQPDKKTIATCDLRISNLMALSAGAKGSGEFEREQALRYNQLTRQVGPKTGYALLSEAGFFGWVAFALLFIWFGLKPGKGFDVKNGLIFAGLSICSYGIWILGLAKA